MNTYADRPGNKRHTTEYVCGQVGNKRRGTKMLSEAHLQETFKRSPRVWREARGAPTGFLGDAW
jgi:hypothetical protein